MCELLEGLKLDDTIKTFFPTVLPLVMCGRASCRILVCPLERAPSQMEVS